jgi:hypothetical protein
MTFKPREPAVCPTTGRKLTEWFENERITDEIAEARVLEELGLDEHPMRGKPLAEIDEEARHLSRIIGVKASSFKRRKWRHSMSKQEVAHRLDEASLMVSEENVKFLDADVQKRTGLELNPLWQMEVLVRSGVLSPKEQVQALTQLASYTHSKAPTMNFNANTNVSPEDWLLELAKTEYNQVELPEPKEQTEPGLSRFYYGRKEATARAMENLNTVQEAELAALEAEDLTFPEGFGYDAE